MRIRFVPVGLTLLMMLGGGDRARAQTRVFVVRLGADTIAVERVVETRDSVFGVVVRHTPTTSVLRYSLRFAQDSTIRYYAEDVSGAEGLPIVPPPGVSPTRLEMRIDGDSVERRFVINGAPAVRGARYSGLLIPAIGQTSPYYQELALQLTRRKQLTQFGMINFAPNQQLPIVFPVRFIGADSAELPMGQGFMRGYRFDANGQLQHADAKNTTVRLDIAPGRDGDLSAIARAWATEEAAGRGMGMPSWRDTVRANIGGATIAIDYGRPAKRGRAIWGTLVPLDTVWRLGANFPTILTTDRDIRIGDRVVRSGSYSLWLVPSDRKPVLLLNRQTSGWVGVPMHDASQDIDSIPVTALRGITPSEERFRMFVRGGTLAMVWDDRGYEVAIASP